MLFHCLLFSMLAFENSAVSNTVPLKVISYTGPFSNCFYYFRCLQFLCYIWLSILSHLFCLQFFEHHESGLMPFMNSRKSQPLDFTSVLLLLHSISFPSMTILKYVVFLTESFMSLTLYSVLPSFCLFMLNSKQFLLSLLSFLFTCV